MEKLIGKTERVETIERHLGTVKLKTKKYRGYKNGGKEQKREYKRIVIAGKDGEEKRYIVTTDEKNKITEIQRIGEKHDNK